MVVLPSRSDAATDNKIGECNQRVCRNRHHERRLEASSLDPADVCELQRFGCQLRFHVELGELGGKSSCSERDGIVDEERILRLEPLGQFLDRRRDRPQDPKVGR